MEVQTDPVVADELWDALSRKDDSNRAKAEKKFINAFLVQLMKRALGLEIDANREAVTQVHSPGIMWEELYGEGIDSKTSASDALSDTGGPSEEDIAERNGFVGSEEELAEEETTFGQENAVLFIEGDVEENIPMKPCISIDEAKASISAHRGVDPANIRLTRDGKNIRKHDTLGEGVIKVDFAEDVDSSEIICGEKRGTPPTVKVVDVKFQREDGSWDNLKVAMVDSGARKQYLGGYRNKKTGDIYYHALSHTSPKRSSVKMFTREVQTYLPTEDMGINTVKSITTQTAAFGLWLPNHTDKIVKPRPYVPHDVKHKTMTPVHAAIIIQRVWRRFMLKNFVEQYMKEMTRMKATRAQFEALAQIDIQKDQLRSMITQSQPTTRDDFSNLFGIVNDWVVEEGKRLLATKTSIQRKVALMNILRDEVKMLYDIETLKIRCKTESLLKQDIMFVEGTARSRPREYPKGNVTLVDDENIQKARIFKEMFASYKRTDTTRTERLDILNCFRATINENFELDLPLLELIELLDREIDMIIMEVADEHLVYLRKRFETLFIALLRDPAINPQAKFFRKSVVPKKKYLFYRCTGCRKILPPHSMSYGLRMPKFSFCKSCLQMQQNLFPSTDLAPYKKILEHLRVAELEKNCRSAISLLLQPIGTYFLVHIIWQGKCIISESYYLPGLRLARWLPNQDWSMWNTILLTKTEAEMHERIPDPLQYYEEEFVLKVRMRNILGRFHFDRVVGIDQHFHKHGTQVGRLPTDHLLYVNKTQQSFIPKMKKPEFFMPTNPKKATT